MLGLVFSHISLLSWSDSSCILGRRSWNTPALVKFKLIVSYHCLVLLQCLVQRLRHPDSWLSYVDVSDLDDDPGCGTSGSMTLGSRFSPALVRFRLNVSYYLDPHDNSVSCRKQPFKVFAYVFLIRDPTLLVIKITRCGIYRQFLVCLDIWALKGLLFGDYFRSNFRGF